MSCEAIVMDREASLIPPIKRQQCLCRRDDVRKVAVCRNLHSFLWRRRHSERCGRRDKKRDGCSGELGEIHLKLGLRIKC